MADYVFGSRPATLKIVRTEPEIVPSPPPVTKISQDWVDVLDVDAALTTEMLEDMDSDPMWGLTASSLLGQSPEPVEWCLTPPYEGAMCDAAICAAQAFL